ncbi:response regulator transcription factor [Variovorax sp. M-6]|uniref:response regulator n=1 Tax=Variovorax sp. M-6 TaxID=3233041 RepID=UPI003F99F1D2
MRISQGFDPVQHESTSMRKRERGAEVRVLLVDDSVAIRQSFGALLANAPEVEVVGCAEDAATALAALASNRPDLIVLDAKLRGHDRGIDVLHHVRRHYPDIKVVVLSQFNWASMRKRYIDAGALAYFDKATEFRQARDCIAALSLSQAAQASSPKP